MAPSRIPLEFNQIRSCTDLCVWEADIDGETVFRVVNGSTIHPQLYLTRGHARTGGDQSFQRIADAILSRPWPPQLEQVTFAILSHVIYDAVDLEGR